MRTIYRLSLLVIIAAIVTGCNGAGKAPVGKKISVNVTASGKAAEMFEIVDSTAKTFGKLAIVQVTLKATRDIPSKAIWLVFKNSSGALSNVRAQDGPQKAGSTFTAELRFGVSQDPLSAEITEVLDGPKFVD